MSIPDATPEAAQERQVPIRTAATKAAAAPTVTRATLKTRPARPPISGEDRYRMIAEAAYFRAEQRGFAPGYELADWLAAEIDIEGLLDDGRGGGVA